MHMWTIFLAASNASAPPLTILFLASTRHTLSHSLCDILTHALSGLASTDGVGWIFARSGHWCKWLPRTVSSGDFVLAFLKIVQTKRLYYYVVQEWFNSTVLNSSPMPHPVLSLPGWYSQGQRNCRWPPNHDGRWVCACTRVAAKCIFGWHDVSRASHWTRAVPFSYAHTHTHTNTYTHTHTHTHTHTQHVPPTISWLLPSPYT